MKDIKITANNYREFRPMIDTCANNSEDDQWCGLFTALYNAKAINNSYYSGVIASFNDEQLRKFYYYLQTQIEFLSFVTIGQCNDDRDYKSANAVRYTIKGLKKLMNSLPLELVAA